jgi:hypothetical protein
MSGVSSVASTAAVTLLASASKAGGGRAADGDSAAQEKAESGRTQIAEAQNGGTAPTQGRVVNKLA